MSGPNKALMLLLKISFKPTYGNSFERPFGCLIRQQQHKPEHVLAHEELVAIEEDARDVAQDEDEDDADEDEGQVDLDGKHDNDRDRKFRKYANSKPKPTDLLFGRVLGADMGKPAADRVQENEDVSIF